MIRRTRFQPPNPRTPPQTARTEIVEPTLGLNRQRPPTNLIAGETPFSQNWQMGDRFIEPRSGLSSFGTSTLATGTPTGFVSAPRSDRSEHAFVLSSSTIRAFDLFATPTQWAPQQTDLNISARTDDYYHFAVGYRAVSSSTTGPSTLFMTNWQMVPMVVAVGQANITKLSALTEWYSFGSYARYVAAFDQRIVFFHSGATNAFVTAAYSAPDYSLYNSRRVSWSARGDGFNYSEGGFEDLADMRGVGTGLIAESDRLVLLSDQEVWAGRPRRDGYAFDFAAIDNSKGCPPDNDRSPCATEIGTVYLGNGQQFYRVVGGAVRGMGDKVRDLLQDEQREWRHAFGLYSANDHVYAFFYSDTTGEYPTRALFLRTDTVAPVAPTNDRDDGSWFLQDFGSYQFTAGGLYNGAITLISSMGTAYRLLSSQTNDHGVAIDARWRSHSLRAERDLFPFEMLQEIWLEAESTSSSALSIYVSTDNGASFSAAGSTSLSSGLNYTQVPLSVAAARNAIFELRLNDGSRPRVARMQAKLRGYTGRYSQ